MLFPRALTDKENIQLLSNSRMKSIYQQGFNLLEVMISLILITLLTGVAVPEYLKTVVKTKQMEARTMLPSIFMSQKVYKLEFGTYAKRIEELSIKLPDNKKYEYNLELDEGNNTYIVTAVANLDSDDAIDTWTINEKNQLIHMLDDAVE